MMSPRYFRDLHGLSLDEAEARVREMIEDAQAAELENYEIQLVDVGGDLADHTAVARLLAERAADHARLREAAIVKMRALVARGGKGLH
jgi:DNA-nicking Smr family endonuclease